MSEKLPEPVAWVAKEGLDHIKYSAISATQNNDWKENGVPLYGPDLMEALIKERERAESLARAVMNDQVSNDQVLSGGSQYVYKVSFPSGECCFFGFESTAKAYARESGTVSQVEITKRDFQFVPIKVKEAYQKQSAIHYDKYITAIQRAEKAEAEAAALRKLLLAVNIRHCNVYCDDLDGKNWFDARDAAIKEAK